MMLIGMHTPVPTGVLIHGPQFTTVILRRVSLGAAQGSSRGTGVTLWRVSIGVLRDLLASVVGVCHGVAPVVCSAPAWPC